MRHRSYGGVRGRGCEAPPTRSNDIREFAPHEAQRYKERSSAERVNSNLKDNFGGRFVRVRGHAKVFSHLMFGLLALTIDQTIRLLI
jgi:Transposase DDE domain